MDNLDQLQAKLDKILNPSMPEPVAIPEVKAEPINPVYYQIAAGMGNNDGAASMSPEEKDLRTLNPNQLIAKYGEENANYMLGNLARASGELQRNNLAERDWGETAWDSTTGAGNAFVGGLGSIVGWGAGKVDAETGIAITDVVESLRRYTEENQSDALNARRRVGAARDALTQRDSDAQYNLDIKNGDSELVAGFAQFGRDVVNSSVFDDSTLLAQGTADAVGSFLTAYPVAGAIKGVAKLLVPKATVRGIGLSGAMDAELGKWTVNRALSHADKLVWPGTIGTLESGGTYQQTVEDAINTLKQQGKTVGDKIEQINDTGQQAADRMFIPAAGLGTITRFGEKPFSVPSLKQAGTNILGRELPEEAGQGALGTILSNQAIQDKIDPNRKIGEGVAQATVQGAVYGSLAAGAVQGPGIAKQSVISAAKATLGYVDKRTALAAEKADDASPVGTKALKEKASTLVPNAEPVKQTLAAELSGTDLTPEEKDQGIKYANDLVDSLKVSVENEFDDTIPPELSAIISGSEHRIDAIQQLGKKVITTSDPNEKLLTAATLYQLLQPILDLQTNRPSSVDNLSPESQAVLKDYESLIANVNNSPTIKNAMKQIHEIMVAQGATVISPVMEEELNTPAGKQKVQSIITAANIAPDQGNLDANESILKHAKEGKLNLTPEQTTTLNASTALLRARKELEEKNKQFGLNAADIVSSEILTDRGVKDNNARSASQYTQEILSAVRRGNTLGAAQLLSDMGLFVKHMRNKVEAINKHYLSGDTSKGSYVAYDALLPTTHQWVRSDTNPKAIHKGGFVNISSPDSIKFVQGVELEHKILADVYNSLTEVFPDLGIDRIEPLQLEKGISGAVRISSEPSKPVAKTEPVKKGKSGVTAKKAMTLGDEDLNSKLDRLQTRIIDGKELNPNQQATFEVLAKEQNRRSKEKSIKEQSKTEVKVVEPKVGDKPAPKIGDTSTEVKGRFTITKTVVSDNTVLSAHTNNEDGKVTKSEYATTYPDIYSDELGDKYTVVIYRDSANPSVITDVESFDPKDKKNSIGSYGKQGNQTDEKFITTFTEASDVTLEYTNKFEKSLPVVKPKTPTTATPSDTVSIDKLEATVKSFVKVRDITSEEYKQDTATVYEKQWFKVKAAYNNTVRRLVELVSKGVTTVEDVAALTDILNKLYEFAGQTIDLNSDRAALDKLTQRIDSLATALFSDVSPEIIDAYLKGKTESLERRGDKLTTDRDGAKSFDGRTIEYAFNAPHLQETNTPTPKQTAPVVETKAEPVTFTGKMTFAYGSNKRSDVESDTTFDAIKAGERTATTRYTTDGKIDYWSKAKVGDIIEFSNKDGDIVRVEVTKPLTKLPLNTDGETWSKKEGWSIDYFNKNVKPKLDKAYQLEYKLIGKAEPKKTKTPESTPPEVVVPATKFELNEGQKNAFTRIMEFINDSRQTFSLVGPAGTGKTTIVNTIIAALRKAGSIYGEVTLTSPTHRANTVTRSKNPNETVVTLHKLLSLSPSIDLDNLTAEDVKFAQRSMPEDKDPFPRKGLIIVDESSMMNKELYNFLMVKLAQYPEVKILFLGDLKQLRPIVKDTKDKDGNTIKAVSTDSPALLDTENQVVLTKVERAKNPELLDESTHVREKGRFTKNNQMKESNGVGFSTNIDEFTNVLVSMFKSKDFLNNRLLVRAVAYTNNRVKEINKTVRTALFGSKAADYIPGDLIMGYKTHLDKEDPLSMLVANGVDYLVLDVGEIRTEVQKGTNKYDMNLPDVSLLVQDLTIKDIYGVDGVSTITVVLPSNTEETWAALGQIYNELSKLPRKNPHMKEEVASFYNSAINRFVLPQDVTIPSVDWNGKPYLDQKGKPKTKSVAKRSIDYGYAHTIHKSQGGTYTYVFVDDTTIGFPADADTQTRLRYVGMTRAEKGAFILVNGKTTGEEPTLADFIESDERITEAELESQYEEEVPVEIPDIDTVTSWARYPTAGVPNIEVSTKGDAFGKQFSALNATLNDGRTIEEAYQVGIKGHASIAAGKGKPPLNSLTKEETWQAYKNLWRDFFDENPELYEELKEKARGKVLTDQFASTFVSQARAISEILNEHYILNIPKNPKKTETPTTEPTNKVDPKTFTNHSGGANGADTFWDIVGRPLGFTNHNHYKESGGTVSSVLAKAKVSITKLDEDQMAFAKKAIDKLFGKGFLERWSKKSEKDLQIRNYYQVANADGVFAIATLDLKNNRVNGGTNTAVQLGIKLGKPVYVWDTTTEQWFKFRGNKFVKTDTPVLTKNFAGVGTRKIANYSVPNERDSAGRIISWTTTKEKGEYLGEAKEAAAKQAIRDVYAKTLSGATPVNEELDNELPIEDNFDDYFNDEGPIVKGNKNAVIKVKPDVVVPSKLKKLVQGIQNFFIQSFKFKGKETTRTDSVGSPLEFVKDALLDNSLFQEAVPNSKYSLNKDVIKAYRSYLGQYYDNLSNTLAKNLQDFLTVPNKKGVVRLNRINKGDPLHRYAEGKVLNLTEKVGDTYKYNQHLLELATLAGLQWFLTAGQTERRLEPREIAKLTGIPEGKLSNSLIDSILNTSDTGQLSQSLTNTIKSFWGVSGINTEMMAYTDGIAEAMAAEILRAFEELGMITKTSIYIDKATNQQLIPDPDYYRKLQELENDVETKKKIKTVIRLEVNRFDNDALYSFPTAIQEVVLIASEDVTYFGDDIPPVPQTQLGDETIKLSRKEKKAVANANKTGVKTNTLQANILMSATEQSIIIAFGGGIENEHMNINTLASIQGKNKTTLNAYRAMVDMLSKVNNVAEKSGIDPSDVVMRFPHTITSVGRAMMLGKYNIQSSKLLREVFLPTWSTLDLQNNQNHYVAFQLGVAQALGIKVHNEGPNSITLVQELLSDQLSPAVSLVQDWMEATDNGNAEELVEFNLIELARIFKVAQKGLTPNAFHALVEYVRYQRTEDKTKFTTGLYLEADGVTNGPGNAIEMLTLGQFTAEWVTTVEKIGHSFAEPKAKHELDKNNPDLYKTGGINSVKHSQAVITKMKQSPDKEKIMQILGSLYSLLSMNVKGITYDPSKLEETGGVLANRDFFKNPLTILVYGSGIPGLAGKAARQMADNIYKRFSDANILLNSKEGKNLTVAQAMFPGDENAEQTYKKFVEDLNRIRSTTINTEYVDRKKVYVVEGVTQPKREYIKSELQKFTFSDSEIDAITQNITKGLVEAMYEGAVETVGRTVMQSSKMIQQATQIQSILLEAAFTKAIQDKIASRVDSAKDTGYMKSDFISKQDFMDIMEELKVIAPYLKTPDQTFLAAKSGRYRNEKDEAIGYSLSLNSKYRTDPNIYIPTNAGVSGTPNLVIGMGDAYAILQAAIDESLVGNLWIYDGINMPLDKILDYAPKLNKAAFEAWQNNPLRVVEESFRSFMGEKSMMGQALKLALDNEDLADQLNKSLRLYKEEDKLVRGSTDYALSIFNDLLNELKNSADSIDARHAAIARMPNSVDQLAAAGVPYHNGITVDPTLDTPEKIAEQLNKYYQEELDKIKNKPKAEPVKQMTPEEMDPITKDMLSNTVTDISSGVKILHAAGLFNLGKSINLSREQRKAYIQLIKSNKLEGYKVVFGSIEQIKKYRELYGYKRVDLDQETDNGFIDMNNKIIHLINPSVETLVHEMIHSATYGSVLNYYQNPSLNTKEVNDAIERTEGLMGEFLKLSPKELARLTPEQRVAINNVKAAIGEPGTNFDNSPAEVQAKALNEFMAWSLSNQDLIAAFKNVKLPTALRIAQEVIAIIKKFFTFKDKATGETKEQDLTIPEDLFGNLLFNASIIINSAQPSLAETMVETTLFHSGTAKHITQLRETLIDKVALFLDKSGQAFNVALYNSGFAKVLTESADTVNSLVPIFGLSAIERSTLHHVVAALSAQIQVDPLTIDGIQTLYAHTVVELAKQVDAGTYPKAKYDALIGRIGNPKIINGKSTLLPVFLGLGLIDTELRDALAKIDMPTKTKNTTGTLNGGLENQANKMLDGLFKVLTGQRKAHDVSDALELLTERLTEIALKEDSAAKSVFNKPGINTDKANEWITDKIAVVADKGIALGKKLETSQYLAVKRLGSAISILSMMATDKNGETVSRGAITMANKGNVWKPFRSLLTDFVGRSDSNAETYDLIKKVRAAVQQMRQTFRDKVPKIIAQKFTRPLDKKEWAILFRSMAKTDLSSLMDILSKKEIMEIFSNPSSINKHISMLETRIQNQDKTNWSLYQAKMKQLAKFMNTGVTGSNLLRNPYAIHRLLNETKPKGFQTMGRDAIHSIDQLTTLYAIQSLSQEDKSFMSDMVNEQSEGLEFIIDYLVGQNVTEITKLSTNPAVQMNYYKGHIPQINQSGASLIVAEDVNRADLLLQGYTRVGDYFGSNLDTNRLDKGYYFTDVSAKGAVAQGTIQNIQRTILGVDDFYGFTIGSNDRITDPIVVANITKRISRENVTEENLLPVFNENGAVIAYERSMQPEKLALLKPSEHLAEMIGVWRGRQLEEQLAQEINEEVIDKHYEMYLKDIANSPSSQKEYVDVLDPKQLDVVEQDMVSLFSIDTIRYMSGKNNGKFYVRKDVLDDMIGYRKASVSDIFTGKTRMNKPLQDAIRKVLIAAFGANAYRKAVKTERFLQNVVGEVRTLIVVKSLVVPMFNIVSNIVQLVARGVPLATIVKSTPTKLLELRSYTMSQVKQVELEAEHRAASGDLRRQQVLESQIQAIKDGHKRLSIWPLIEAGEFSTISDIGNNSEDIDLFSGNTESWLDKQVSKLPANAQTVAKYGMVARDTALFQGLQKMVQYGDFIAKAVMYDDLIKRKGLTKEQALGKITDEFVNYDKLPGRGRGYLEDMGVFWFWNYKLRITKIALSMMRNNPLHLLLAHAMPIPLGAGIATEDNFITKLLDGSLTSSIGPGMVVGAPLLNPWYNAMN